MPWGPKILFADPFSPRPMSFSWTPNTDCCSCEGITCDSSTGHVIGLDLTYRWIKGSINSTTLIFISSIQTLNLSYNYFNCSIPIGLDRLWHHWPVPIEISRMKSLVMVDLSWSNHSEWGLSLPTPIFEYVIGNLTGLRALYLYGVLISAHVPRILADVTNLSSIHHLTGELPSKIFYLRNLKSLDVSFNSLVGALPSSSNLTQLVYLDISGNSLHGHIPSLVNST